MHFQQSISTYNFFQGGAELLLDYQIRFSILGEEDLVLVGHHLKL